MPAWHDGIFDDDQGGDRFKYRLLLPDDYRETNRSYPVLYLLHGLFGSFENWTEFGGVTSQPGLIIVMPDGADGWYCDGVSETDRFESRLLRGLIPAIESRFRTAAGRSGRLIAGNSMGGYGALKIAFRYPDEFAFAASFSGAFEAPNWSDDRPPENWEEYRPSISRIFGSVGSDVRIANDIYRLAGHAEPDLLPEIYFDCGVSDPFLTANRQLSAELRRRGIRHHFDEADGGHDWAYWSARIVRLIRSELETNI